MAEQNDQTLSATDIDLEDLQEVTTAVLTASRVLVALAARSLGAAKENVTLPQFRALVIIAAQGPMKVVELADRLNVNPSTAVRMLDRLEAAGLVHRQVNPDVRRELILQLTERGRGVVEDVTARRREDIALIVARIPAKARRGMIQALRAFADAAGEPPADERPSVPLGWH